MNTCVLKAPTTNEKVKQVVQTQAADAKQLLSVLYMT